MASTNNFSLSPLDVAASEAEQRLHASRQAAAGIGSADIPVEKDVDSLSPEPQRLKVEIKYKGDFDNASKKTKVPVNVLMALADMDQSFDHKNPAASIDAIAAPYAQLKSQGFNDEEAVRALFAGTDKSKWNNDTEKMATAAFDRAR